MKGLPFLSILAISSQRATRMVGARHRRSYSSRRPRWSTTGLACQDPKPDMDIVVPTQPIPPEPRTVRPCRILGVPAERRYVKSLTEATGPHRHGREPCWSADARDLNEDVKDVTRGLGIGLARAARPFAGHGRRDRRGTTMAVTRATFPRATVAPRLTGKEEP
jgi:hypothetical protein